ncbi:hypothetical protein EN828_25195 [Mesorhizobium sp. M2D.F.Ca.ET.185.01.1.1]|uniref:hypothetical protein n=1 Tax=unclassified Mesorhizobium TaxID=325217 RepID=UPI000FCB3F0D|nr:MULTISPECIES: hypothetical protein [unclassified Mesorhizobium]TGP74348.1 hypothetical protein EN870_27015 [bacterium M00.F.Ca.ET.227.01.1.1]TGP85034.1 hypothetical protein EN864_27120 [bacterium M00.F.Ca.ET.221.01.1.1]TGP89117.1 hypothetical protein EN865_25545 [bacterium M00.F.Ca.ET.222.01.1.1]TGU12825.1 hypothetical protein EN806_15720 [bacterium M00.F.Ca.ET.163.01.1.1]TGU21272.1 hypothetical protein EN799_53880 [bacterium M00.F.Ca.ET.156.01.1.1]TGU43669.1 hypothetical protein EN789_261
MIEIVFEGSEEQRARVRTIAQESGLAEEIIEKDGVDGAEIIRITLQYGPDILKVLTSLVVLVEECIKARSAYNITFKNKKR